MLRRAREVLYPHEVAIFVHLTRGCGDLLKLAASIEETNRPNRDCHCYAALMQDRWNNGVNSSAGKTIEIFIRQSRFFRPKLTLLDVFPIVWKRSCERREPCNEFWWSMM